MRIALAQINSVVGDLAGNAERMYDIYNQALGRNVDVLVFPELAICGYPPEDLLHKQYFLADARRVVENLAGRCTKMTIVAGFAEGSRGRCYNSAAVIRDGKISRIYRKALLPNYGIFDEQRYFDRGKLPMVINLHNISTAITICRDIWDSDWLSNFLKNSAKISMVINISASPFHIGKMQQRQSVIRSCATELDCAVCYCNLVGGADELVFDGRSLFADSKGNIVLKAKAFEEDMFIADITKSGSAELHIKAEQPMSPQPRDSIDEVYQALVLGTKDYIQKNNFKKVLLGLSGGIDSSVAAAIAAAAIGPENVIGITMPSKFNSPQTRADAEKLANNLKIEFLTIPIDLVLGQFDKALSDVQEWNNQGIAYENLQARIRGNILMSLSNQLSALVLTSGNKSETAVGYTTLYGDTAGGFAVIKDVYKTMVYKLADHINSIAAKQIIPQTVLSREPSAELRANQKDTDSLACYDLLDEILTGYIEQDKSAEQLIGQHLPSDVVLKVIQMVDRNEYKRRQSPPGVRITPKAFGKDRRLPITNRYSHYTDTKSPQSDL